MEPIWKLKRIGILSAMKIGCVCSGAFGFIVGTIWGIMLAFFSSLITMAFDKPVFGFGAAVVIITPFAVAFLYAILGTLLSFIMALLYNIVSGIFGGIEFEMAVELIRGRDTMKLKKQETEQN